MQEIGEARIARFTEPLKWDGGDAFTLAVSCVSLRLSKAQKLKALEARLMAVEDKRRQLSALSKWLKRLHAWVAAGEIGPKPRLQ